MSKRVVAVVLVVGLGLLVASAGAQEVKIHHGFLFFASEEYTMDEKTYGIREDGHEFARVIKDNPKALDAYGTYKAWHVTAIVCTGVALAAFVFGGVYYGFQKDMDNAGMAGTGVASFITGGGLLALGVVFEFVSWGSITNAATIYNKGLIDEGPGSNARNDNPLIPKLAVGPGAMSLTWRF